MKHIILFIIPISLFLSAFAAENNANPQPTNSISIEDNELLKVWDSPEGIKRLQNSKAKEPLWKLLRFYESQINLKYCGVATCVITLNALSIEAPPSKILGKYRMFTQEEFFSDNVLAVIDQNDVAERGLALEEMATVLKTFPINVLKYEAQQLSHEEIRSLIISALQKPNQCVLALYHRKALNQEGIGHWSPIAAYDEESDSFLLLDVAKFKYPPVWIDASAFINSMQTANMYDQSRGFIVAEKI